MVGKQGRASSRRKTRLDRHNANPEICFERNHPKLRIPTNADYVLMMRRCSCNRCVAAREAAAAKASESTSADATGGGTRPDTVSADVVTVRDQATATNTSPANGDVKEGEVIGATARIRIRYGTVLQLLHGHDGTDADLASGLLTCMATCNLFHSCRLSRQ